MNQYEFIKTTVERIIFYDPCFEYNQKSGWFTHRQSLSVLFTIKSVRGDRVLFERKISSTNCAVGEEELEPNKENLQKVLNYAMRLSGILNPKAVRGVMFKIKMSGGYIATTARPCTHSIYYQSCLFVDKKGNERTVGGVPCRYCHTCQRYYFLSSDSKKVAPFVRFTKQINEQEKKKEPEPQKMCNGKDIPLFTIFIPMKFFSGDQVVEREVNVPYLDRDGMVKRTGLKLKYCKLKNAFFVSDSFFERFTKLHGLPLIEYDYDINGTNKKGLNNTSVLYKNGYRVDKKSSLTLAQRRGVLRYIIREKIITKGEVLSHLAYLIRFNGAPEDMKDARHKWQEDFKWVEINL